MLSYRHGFHAGNPADVIKHIVLIEVLNYLTQKDKKFIYLDSHAGAGKYDLTASYAQKNKEFNQGIGKIWHYLTAFEQSSKAKSTNGLIPESVLNYLLLIKKLNIDGNLHYYPGSPWIAQELLRSEDTFYLSERHSKEAKILELNLNVKSPNKIFQENGYTVINRLLPPPCRRGLIFIDPPYENDSEYFELFDSLQSSIKKFATGCYLVWYPILASHASIRLAKDLVKLNVSSWYHLIYKYPAQGENRLRGCGLFVINPPWQLANKLAPTLPWLEKELVNGGSFTVDTKLC